MQKTNRTHHLGRFSALLASLLMVSVSPAATAQTPPGDPGAAVYGSLKTDRVEAHPTPGLEKPSTVVFRRSGMPVMLLERAKDWQQVRDVDGTTGWVYANLVSKRRTAVVRADASRPGDQASVRARETPDSAPIAYLEPGVIVGLISCERSICRVSTASVRGFIDQRRLWGAGDSELRP